MPVVQPKEQSRHAVKHDVRNPVGTCPLHHQGEKRIESKGVEEHGQHQQDVLCSSVFVYSCHQGP